MLARQRPGRSTALALQAVSFERRSDRGRYHDYCQLQLRRQLAAAGSLNDFCRKHQQASLEADTGKRLAAVSAWPDPSDRLTTIIRRKDSSDSRPYCNFRSRPSHLSSSLALFQDAPANSFSLVDMWGHMSWIPEVHRRYPLHHVDLVAGRDHRPRLYFSAARKQSREFAPKVAGALKNGNLDEAIKVADRTKKSHLAEVVTSGLQEFRSFGSGGAITEEQIEAQARSRAFGSDRSLPS